MLVQKDNVQLEINEKELERFILDGFKEVKVEKSTSKSKKDEKIDYKSKDID